MDTKTESIEQTETVVGFQSWARSSAATARAGMQAHRDGYWPAWKVIAAQQMAARHAEIAREQYDLLRGAR